MIMKSSDCGRTESGYKEKNDCVVRAYSAVTGMDYKLAHGYLFLQGRKMRRGFAAEQFFISEFGQPKFNEPHMTVENMVKFIAHTGKWLITIRGHVFAVIDGVIIDINPIYNLKCHVVKVWEIK